MVSQVYFKVGNHSHFPVTVVILRDQAEEFPLCQQLYMWFMSEFENRDT